MGWVEEEKVPLMSRMYCEEGKRYFRYREQREQGHGDMEASGIWGDSCRGERRCLKRVNRAPGQACGTWPCAKEFSFITGGTRVLGKEWSHHETRFRTWKISEAIKIFKVSTVYKNIQEH